MASVEMMSNEAQSGSGLDLGQLLRRRKLLLLLGLIVGGTSAYIWYVRQPPTYESKARILLTYRKSENLPVESAGFKTINRLANEQILIKSERVLLDAIEIKGLAQKKSFVGRDIPNALLGGLTVTQIDETDILEVSFRGSHRGDCKDAVDAVTEAYVALLKEAETDSHKDIQKLLSETIDQVQQQLLEEEQKYEEFRKQADLIWLGGEGVNPHAKRFADIESSRTQVLVEKAQINAELASITAARLGPNGDDVALRLLVDKLSQGRADQSGEETQNRVETESLTEKLFQMLLEEELLLDELGAQHPKVKELRKQIEFTHNYLTKKEAELGGGGPRVNIVDAYVNRLHLEHKTLEKKEADLTALLNSLADSATALSTQVVQNENFVASIDRKRQLWEELCQTLSEVTRVQNYEGRKADVIAPASFAYQVGPDFARYIGIGLVLGLLAGFGLACLIELADKSFRSPDDLMAELAIPVLSHIPYMHDVRKNAKGAKDVPYDNALITVLRPKSQTAEAFRSVRTALYFSTSGELHKIVQVTSPVAGDGKSTLAANLAVGIAHSGKKVLLVDADLRRPTVHRLFGVENKTGVTSVVADGMQIGDAVKDVGIENLQVLTCGRRPDNPSELLLSGEFDDLLENVRQMYDFVVIDSPPILAVTDPASVAARADGVIVTLRLAKRSRDLARRAVEQLQSVGANVLGVVVNGVDPVESYGYRSYQYGAYAYGAYGQGYGAQSGYYDEGTNQPSAPKRPVVLEHSERA